MSEVVVSLLGISRGAGVSLPLYVFFSSCEYYGISVMAVYNLREWHGS